MRRQFRPELRNWQSLVRDGLLEAGVDPYNGFSLEHLVGTKIGGSTCDSSGRRHSAADLLNYANPVNIQVAVYASVERVLLASTSQSSRSRLSAIGVVYLDQMFENRLVMVGESFLCFSFRPSFGLATQCPNREKGELLVRKFLMGLITFPAHRPASFRHSCTQTEQH